MSDTIVCHGCGATVPVPDDYARNKMQCPECGVMCPVPPGRPTKKKVAERAPAEEAVLFEDDAPAPTTTYSDAPIPAGKGTATCPACGELVRVPSRKARPRRVSRLSRRLAGVGRPAEEDAAAAAGPAAAGRVRRLVPRRRPRQLQPLPHRRRRRTPLPRL